MAPLKRAPTWTQRRLLLSGIAAAAALSAIALGLSPAGLLPQGAGGWDIASRIFSAAVRPALTYEADYVPPGTAPLLMKTLLSMLTTVKFAAASVSLSLLAGLFLGVVSSESWSGPPWLRWMFRGAGTLARSIHELIWAVFFLAALGLTPATAVCAIAIPYTGTFAKIFSEMLDEAPRAPAQALAVSGASRLQTFFLGLVPCTIPDLISYTFYRFECGLRSAAVMGFMGIPTLGSRHSGFSSKSLSKISTTANSGLIFTP